VNVTAQMTDKRLKSNYPSRGEANAHWVSRGETKKGKREIAFTNLERGEAAVLKELNGDRSD